MPGINDVGPLQKMVPVRDVEIPIKGITARGINDLLFRFPQIKSAFSPIQRTDELVQEIIGLGDEIAAAVCAAGTGCLGDKEAEEKYRSELVLGEVIEILAEIMEITFPKGVAAMIAQVGRIRAAAVGGPTPSQEEPAST